MTVFGCLLLVLAAISAFVRDADVLGVDPLVLGGVLAVLGVALIAVGVLRARRRRASGEPHPVGNPFQRARALPRLIREARRGEYGELPKSRFLLWAGAVVYLVSPVDVLPELLPIIGVTDDAGVAVWLLTSVSTATGMFLRWERNRRGSGPALPRDARQG
ncbi:YkvA family protein [Umezawaea beigongshangensis]|uniref:YkvA family protein n=1 Tax=Umezawaea beigongshangensis TaxID=2780383 RepID=UPI0018F11429|nr:YkvA family protein [Umezawaea beigongshangensis]